MDKWDYIKIKNFHASKDTINRAKRQPLRWEKIFGNRVSDKELITRIYKELQLNNTQAN